MEKDARLIELRDRNGGLLFSFLITAKTLSETPGKGKESPSEKGASPEKGDGKPKNSELLMTEAQKRYLFRLLAEQGKEEEEAHNYLKELFQVKSLTEVPRIEASQAIERLLAEANKGGEEDGTPF